MSNPRCGSVPSRVREPCRHEATVTRRMNSVRRRRRTVSWAGCGCRGRSSSWTSPASRTTPRRLATTPPAGSSARSGALVREVASERGARIAKWLGDGCMVVAIEQADGDRFVIDLEQRAADVCAPLTLRAGIATGHALLFEGDDYIGSAVNMAARLCDHADRLRRADAHDASRSAATRASRPRHTARSSCAASPVTIDVVRLHGAPTEVRHDTGELWTRNPLV